MVSCASIRLPMRATRSTSEEPTIAQSPTSLGTMRGIVPHVCAAGRARLGGGLRTGARLGGGFRAAAGRARLGGGFHAAAAAFFPFRSRARSRTATQSGTWPLRRILRGRAARRIAAGTRVLDVLLRLVGARVSILCRWERICRFRPPPEDLATCLSQPAIRTGSSFGSAIASGTMIEARRLLEPCEKQANAAPLALAAARQTRTQSTLAQQDLGQENQPEPETEASGVLSVTAVP